MILNELKLPIRAATEVAAAHGIVSDRCDILQNGSTLVLRLTDTLVARVVVDRNGPRQGMEWFARENAVAMHLAQLGAPVIPLHPELPPGPYEHLGYPMNFWQFVTAVSSTPEPMEIGRTLYQCHDVLRSFPGELPELAILSESVALLDDLGRRRLFPGATLRLLENRLVSTHAHLKTQPMQALHGDAHYGNLMNTSERLLWTDWEDTFQGPIEWDLASITWNARILEADHATADAILLAYEEAGGVVDQEALHHSLIARAAVMSAWYPILYPDPSPERQQKLQFRLDWLERNGVS